MRNIFLLPTDKPSSLVLETKNNNLFITTTKDFGTKIMKFQHIYITSDEEIKDRNCWVTNGVEIFKPSDLPEYSLEYANRYWEKIILTTDQELIADGVQAIDDEFLQWFVNNSSCEKVEVELIDTFKKTNEVYVDEIAGGNYYEIIKQYKIIIPQEETKQKACDNCNNDVCCCTIKKQETVEEAAEMNCVCKTKDCVHYKSFISGVKSDAAKEYWCEKFKAEWYNEEEVLDLLYKLWEANPRNIKEWFEQFKKK
jgi:hypothetical protein